MIPGQVSRLLGHLIAPRSQSIKSKTKNKKRVQQKIIGKMSRNLVNFFEVYFYFENLWFRSILRETWETRFDVAFLLEIVV